MLDDTVLHSQQKQALSHVLRRGFWSRLLYRMICLILTPLGILISRLWFGIRVINKDLLWSYSTNGCFLVSNHVYYLDPLIILYALYPAKPVFSVLEETMQVKGLGAFLRLMGCFAIPKMRAMPALTTTINSLLEQWRFIHFFPEGDLRHGSQQLLRFRKGVFYLAFQTDKPIIPMTLVLRSRCIGKWKLSFLPKRVDVVIGKPVHASYYKNEIVNSINISDKATIRHTIQKMLQDTQQQMQNLLQVEV